MSEWQPIETAPKDREILISGGKYGFDDSAIHSFTSVAIAFWNQGCGFFVNGCVEDEYLRYKPKYWMPLPEPFKE